MLTQASRIGMWGLVAAGALAGPSLASAQCRDYAVRRVYTAPVVVRYAAAPAYPVVTYPVYTEPVYVEPVYVAAPVVTTYTRYYRPAVSVHVGRGYGWRDHGYRHCYTRRDHHRGWSAGVRVDGGRHGRSFEFNLSRHRR